MRKYLIGLLLGLVLMIPVSTYAWVNNNEPQAKQIYRFNCERRDMSAEGVNNCDEVSTFSHNGNRCYISFDPNGGYSSISCVRPQ